MLVVCYICCCWLIYKSTAMGFILFSFAFSIQSFLISLARRMKLVHFLFRVLKYSLSNYEALEFTKFEFDYCISTHRRYSRHVVTFNCLIENLKRIASSMLFLITHAHRMKLINFLFRVLKDCVSILFSSVPGRFVFYGVIRGYFDSRKIPLKFMLDYWASGSN